MTEQINFREQLKEFGKDFLDFLITALYYIMAAITRLALLAMGIVLLYCGITTWSPEVQGSMNSLLGWEKIVITLLTSLIGLPVGSLLVIKMLTSSNENLTEL